MFEDGFHKVNSPRFGRRLLRRDQSEYNRRFVLLWPVTANISYPQRKRFGIMEFSICESDDAGDANDIRGEE